MDEWPSVPSSEYATQTTYDPAGNIRTMDRTGYTSGGSHPLEMDEMTYLYESGKNHLVDTDLDWVPDDCDGCEETEDPWQEDYDGDGVGDICDNCPFVHNPRVGGVQPTCSGGGGGGGMNGPELWWQQGEDPIVQHGWNSPLEQSRGGWMNTWPSLAELLVYGKYSYGRFATTQLEELRDTVVKTQNQYTREIDKKLYELKDHLQNVRVVISDVKLNAGSSTSPIFTASLHSYNNYYPYGMTEPGRSYQPDQYRFGFSGKEEDNEMNGDDNAIDFGARIYNPRLARWLSMEPHVRDYPWMTPYSYAANMPTNHIDPDGERVRFVFPENFDGNNIATQAEEFLSYISEYSEIMKWLVETDELEITVMVNTQYANEFRGPYGRDNVVWWDPFVAIKTTTNWSNGMQNLLHEMIHVLNYHRPKWNMDRKIIEPLRDMGSNLLTPKLGLEVEEKMRQLRQSY